MTQKELTPQIAAMYLGCEAETPKGIGRIEGVDVFGMVWVNVDLCVNISKVTLLLRPLSDMTDDEAKEIDFLVFDFNENTTHFERHAARTTYLLSRHFDLFGLIEAGLAKDKTKI